MFWIVTNLCVCFFAFVRNDPSVCAPLSRVLCSDDRAAVRVLASSCAADHTLTPRCHKLTRNVALHGSSQPRGHVRDTVRVDLLSRVVAVVLHTRRVVSAAEGGGAKVSVFSKLLWAYHEDAMVGVKNEILSPPVRFL